MFSFLKNLFCNGSPAQSYGTSSPARSSSKKRAVKVRDAGGRERPLGKELARGGEGVIHTLDDRPDWLVKIYHARVLEQSETAGRLQAKIAAMTRNTRLRSMNRLAWPGVELFDSETGQWRGYAMRRQPGMSLQGLLGAPVNLREFAPHWNRLHLVRLCLDFLDTIETLAAERALPVDFNPCNFLVDTDKVRFHFIDCDGYQFLDPDGRLHLCEAVRPDLAPPEMLRRQRWDEEPAKPESLRFSVGMILFFILNLGNNPFRHRNGEDPVSNLLSGRCALGHDSGCQLPNGPWYLIWSHLTYDLKSLFIRCFRDGHSDPSRRPQIKEWRGALRRYEARLLGNQADAAPIPAAAKRPD